MDWTNFILWVTLLISAAIVIVLAWLGITGIIALWKWWTRS